MIPIVAMPVFALVFGILGFVVHPLWWIAIALAVIWVLGFTFKDA